MSPFQTFVWGVVGAFIAYVALFVLPILVAKSERKSIDVSFPWMGLRMVFYILLGGLFAMIIGDATLPKHAAFYGAGWESGFKGLGEGARILGKKIE